MRNVRVKEHEVLKKFSVLHTFQILKFILSFVNKKVRCKFVQIHTIAYLCSDNLSVAFSK